MSELLNTYFNPGIFRDSLWILIKTLPTVFAILFLSLAFSYLWGLVLSLLRLSRFRLLRYLSGAYIDFFRGLPLLMLLMFVYYALPYVGVRLSPLVSSVLALTLCYGAYSAEIFRAGILAIPRGQIEAARSLGMTHVQAMRYVVLPQAIRLVIPPLTNELIAMIKDTSLCSVIAVAELLFRAKELMGVVANPTPVTVAAIIYVIFTIPLIRLAARLETKRKRRSHIPDKGAPSGPSEAEQELHTADIAGQLP
ncbi:MAG: amino acid ABC transporter permease [Thermoleophilia bacterium]|nr:amino acid ABC transporter permease [Thermoleophilia bacterium]